MSGKSRAIVSLALTLVFVMLSLATDNNARTAMPVTTAALMARERPNGVTSIGIETIQSLPTPRRFDELLATLPSDKPVQVGYAPQDWKLEQKGKQLHFRGPATDQLRLRLDLNASYFSDYAGKSATVQTGLAGKLDDALKINIAGLPPVRSTPNLEGILTIPPAGTPGQPFLVGVADPYRDGTWHLTTDGGAIPLIPVEQLRDMTVITPGMPQGLYGQRGTDGVINLLSRPAPRPFMSWYPETGRFTGARFIDRWGELLVDAPISIAPASMPAGPRSLTGGSAFAFAGQSACVSGNFPRFQDSTGLLLDGKIELPVWGGSQTTIMVGIPANIAAGPHTITVPGGSSSVTIGVLTVDGSLDENKLWKGESTTMRLRVIGTDQKLPLGVLNRTPDVITIDGGIQQTVTTAGGKDNAVTRNVKGIHRGNFTIVYSVNTPGCGVVTGK